MEKLTDGNLALHYDHLVPGFCFIHQIPFTFSI